MTAALLYVQALQDCPSNPCFCHSYLDFL